MKNVIKNLCSLFAVLILILSCQQKNKENEYKELDKMSGVNNSNDKERKFAQKANVTLESKNCLETTNLIEQRTKDYKGFILNSLVNKIVQKEVCSTISTDSLKKASYFTTTANVEVRIPDTSLQQFLLYVQSISSSINNRNIIATDVTFDATLNKLNLKDNIVVNSKDTDVKLTKNEKIVDNLRLLDAVKYASVQLIITQPTEIKTEFIINEDASWAKQTALTYQAWFQLQKGFYQLTYLIILFLQFWWVAPLLIGGKFIYTRVRKFY